jgi:dihydrodipicolinate synthase/N-acetylneuraminate lyase
MNSEKKLLNVRGIITVLNTPFTSKNEIDFDAISRNVQYAIESGVVGFLVPAMASEVDKLSEQERSLFVQRVVKEAKGRVTVIGGASASKPEDRLKYAKNLIAHGCDGILANIPFESETQYFNDVQSLAKLNPPFLMLQDVSFNNYGLPIPLITKLFNEIDCFRALKVEVVPAGVKYSEVLKLTNGKLHVSGGWAAGQLIEGLDRGIHAFMPTGMHEIYVKISQLYNEGKRENAKRLFFDLLPVLAFSNQHLDISIHFFKRLLWKQGIYPTPNVRAPILPFDSYHIRIADELIDLVVNLIQKIKDKKYD